MELLERFETKLLRKIAGPICENIGHNVAAEKKQGIVCSIWLPPSLRYKTEMARSCPEIGRQ